LKPLGPEFPPATEERVVGRPREFQARIDKLRARMEERRLSHLVVSIGCREHFAYISLISQTSILVLKKLCW